MKMKQSLIFLIIIALLQLSFALPRDSSVKIEAAAAQIDGSKLDTPPYSQAQLSGQSAESSRVVSGINSAPEGQSISEEAVAGLPQVQILGQVGEAQSRDSESVVNGAQPQVQVAVDSQAANGGAKVVSGAQTAGDTQVAGGAKSQLSGPIVNEEVHPPRSGHVAVGIQAANGGAQVQLSGQISVGNQANGSGPVKFSEQTGGAPQISMPTAGGQSTGKAQDTDGPKQGAGGSQVVEGVQAYLSRQDNVEAQPNLSKPPAGDEQLFGGEKTAEEGQANERKKDVAETGLSQESAGAPEAPLSLPLGFQPQDDTQASRSGSLSIQTNKQSPQNIGGVMPSNLPIKISETGRSQAGVGIAL